MLYIPQNTLFCPTTGLYSLFRSVVRLGGGPQSHSLSSEVKVKVKMNGQSDEL